MRNPLPSGPSVREPTVAGATYASVAGVLGMLFALILAGNWLTGPGGVIVLLAVVTSAFVATTLVWRWLVPVADLLGYGRAAGCGALVGVLSHLFAGPLVVVFVVVVGYVYELLLLENLLGFGLNLWMEPSWFSVLIALVYSVVSVIATAGIPILVSIALALVLANRQHHVEE